MTDLDVGFEPPPGWNPTEAILRGLAASATGERYDAEEMEMASYVLAGLALVSRGVSEDTAIRAVQQAAERGNIHISWSETAGLEVTIGSLDAEDVVGPDAETVTFDDGDEACDG